MCSIPALVNVFGTGRAPVPAHLPPQRPRHTVRPRGTRGRGRVGGCLASGFLGGTLSDRAGPKRVLFASLAVMTLAFALMPLIRTAGEAFAIYTVWGVGSGAFWPSQSALLAGLTPATRRAPAYALQRLAMNVGWRSAAWLSEGRSRMRGLAPMGTLWAATLLAVWAAGAWTYATAAFAILAAAALVFAVGECLHGAIHAPLSLDRAPPQLVGRYVAAASISWQIGWIIGPAAGGFLLQHRPLLLWPIAAGVNLACSADALALEARLPVEVRRTPLAEPAQVLSIAASG